MNTTRKNIDIFGNSVEIVKKKTKKKKTKKKRQIQSNTQVKKIGEKRHIEKQNHMHWHGQTGGAGQKKTQAKL